MMSPAIAIVVASLALAAVAAMLVRSFFLGYPPPILARSTFSRKEQAVLAACADALFPPGGPIPLSGTEAGLVAYMDGYVGRMPSKQRVLVRLLLWFIEHTPWVFGPRRARFTLLSHEERLAVLDGMAQSSVYFRRIAFLSMRAMLTMGYLAHPEVARSMRMECCAAPFEPRAQAEGEVVVRAGAREVFA